MIELAVVRKPETGLDPDELDRLSRSLAELASELRTEAEEEFSLPAFESAEEREQWWQSRPVADVEVDPELLKTISTSIRLSQRTIDGYNALAKELGFRSGQTLMKAVLNNFLARRGSLPASQGARRVSSSRVRQQKDSPRSP